MDLSGNNGLAQNNNHNNNNSVNYNISHNPRNNGIVYGTRQPSTETTRMYGWRFYGPPGPNRSMNRRNYESQINYAERLAEAVGLGFNNNSNSQANSNNGQPPQMIQGLAQNNTNNNSNSNSNSIGGRRRKQRKTHRKQRKNRKSRRSKSKTQRK